MKEINYFFGANGTGKTTISRVIADCMQFPDCSITWAKGLPLKTLVYNRDFVDLNFKSVLKGIFTLGEQEIDTLAKIESAKGEIEKLKSDITGLTITLRGDNGKIGKKQELAELEEKYKERFWKTKKRYEDTLAGKHSGEGIRGFLDAQIKFLNKVLAESESNTSDLLPLAELESKAETVFSNKLTQVGSMVDIQPQRILSLEQEQILEKRVIGKEDVNISAIIKKLDNSDWVRQGLPYYQVNDDVCPFCQQKVGESFSEQLKEYFDETFQQDRASINALATDYLTESKRMQQQLETIINLHSPFMDKERLETVKKLLDSTVAVNIQRFEKKKEEPSLAIKLDSLKKPLDTISELIVTTNEKIIAHNAVVNNITHEKTVLTKQIWRFIVEELKNDIDDYKNGKNSFVKVIENLETQLKEKNDELIIKERELKTLESQNVGILATTISINGLLGSFGFNSFRLAEGDDGKTYKLVRPDGSDAQDTLSEGERNFVTFLYFYHLLKGSQTESGMSDNKVVVFDDPVSSLDSDVLFIVSSLIRKLFEDIRQNQGTIKQMFVLTHNAYFYKEIAYNPKRDKKKALKDVTFWMVRKNDKNTFVERRESNPIKTTYELLWEEVRTEPRNNATIRNTIRRILENYFKMVGGISLDSLYEEFDGDSKIQCKTLCSWIHDGSHSAFNDEHYIEDNTTVERYLEIFKQIFEKSKHIAHYDMMMKQP